VKGWAVFGLVAGLALAVFGVTRGLGAWAARPAHASIDALGRGQALGDASLDEGVAALQRAAAGRGASARSYGNLALLQLERARRAGPVTPGFTAVIDSAVEAQRAGLAGAPADGPGWARLVYAEKLRAQAPGASPPGLATSRALEMAFLTRDLSFSLVRFRLGAALDDWATIRPWLRAAARAEVLELTRYGARGMDALVDLYLRSPRPDVIDEELAADPAQKAYFEKRLARRLQQR
jgi:hypothetical protein